jgi:hypothetical protein
MHIRNTNQTAQDTTVHCRPLEGCQPRCKQADTEPSSSARGVVPPTSGAVVSCGIVSMSEMRVHDRGSTANSDVSLLGCTSLIAIGTRSKDKSRCHSLYDCRQTSETTERRSCLVASLAKSTLLGSGDRPDQNRPQPGKRKSWRGSRGQRDHRHVASAEALLEEHGRIPTVCN